MKILHLSLAGSALLAIGLLSSCDSDSSSAPPTAAPVASASVSATLKVEGLVQSVLPDSVLWNRGSASGKLAIDISTTGNSVTIDVSSLASATTAGARAAGIDTAWISLWTSGILTTKLPYVYGSADAVVPANAQTKDTVAWNLLKVRDSLPRDSAGKAPGVAQVFAQMVLSGDVRFTSAALPKGLPVDSVRVEGVRLAGTVAISSTAMKSLGLDSSKTDSLRKVMGIPVAPSVPKDTTKPVVVTDTMSKHYAPVFSLASGTYDGARTVTLTSSLTGSVIRYTTDSTTPTDSSPVYKGPILVSKTTYIHAFASTGTVKSYVSFGWYAIAAPSVPKDTTKPVVVTDTMSKHYAPVFSLASGTYDGARTVTLTSSLTSSVIRYTTDSTTPTDSSPVYKGPILVSKTTYIHAFASTGTVKSYVSFGWYAIAAPSVPKDTTKPVVVTDTMSKHYAPVFSLASGTYDGARTVTLTSSLTGSVIRYTTDSTTPTDSSPVYKGPILVSKTTYIHAFASTGTVKSYVSFGWYAIAAPSVPKDTTKPVVVTDTMPKHYAPVFSLASGTYDGARTVTLTSSLTGSVIRYTTDSTTPTDSSPVYKGPILVSKTTYIHAFASTGTVKSYVSFGWYAIAAPSIPKDTVTSTSAPKDTSVAKNSLISISPAIQAVQVLAWSQPREISGIVRKEIILAGKNKDQELRS